MAVTYGYVDSTGGARICYATEPGIGVPVLTVLQSMFPAPSVFSRYESVLSLTRGIAGGAPWYVFDLRGTGRSRVPPGPVTFEQLVDDVEALAEVVGEPFDLSAVNDGCAVAMSFAVRRPELVHRMLLVAPVAGAALPEPEWQAYLATADRRMGLAQFLMWVHPGADPADCFAIAEAAIAAQPPEAIVALRRAAVSVNPAELSRKVLAPSLLISTGDEFAETLALASGMPLAQAANWTNIGDGAINGPAWRRAWDERIPPETAPDPRALGYGGGETGLYGGGLSMRELEVLRLIAGGKTNHEIAEALVIAEGTVSRHVHNILTKLGLPNRSAAATWAAVHGVRPSL